MTDSRTGQRARGTLRRRQGQQMQSDDERQEVMDAFLQSFRTNGNVLAAARTVGVSTSTVYKWGNENRHNFAERFREAEADAFMIAEAALWEEGVVGVQKPITVAGKREVVRERNVQALIAIIKAGAPWKYRDHYDGEGQAPAGFRAAAQANAQATVINITVDGRGKRVEELSPAEVDAALEVIEGEIAAEAG